MCFMDLSCEVKKLENLSAAQYGCPFEVLSHLKVIPLSYNSSGVVQSYQSESPSAQNLPTIVTQLSSSGLLTDICVSVFTHSKILYFTWYFKACEPLIKCSIKAACDMWKKYKKSLNGMASSLNLTEVINILLCLNIDTLSSQLDV